MLVVQKGGGDYRYPPNQLDRSRRSCFPNGFHIPNAVRPNGAGDERVLRCDEKRAGRVVVIYDGEHDMGDTDCGSTT